MKRTVVQPGQGSPTDLLVYCHIDPTIIAQHVREVTTCAVVTELWGAGTTAYRDALPAYGGTWAAYVSGIVAKLSKQVARSCLTTWSAGSQVAKDVCAAGGSLPDALVMLDGLYAGKPAGAKPGDGKVDVDSGLRALCTYALRAARGECVMVVLHSAIPTPYASSAECARFLRAYVEAELGVAMTQDASLSADDMDRHAFTEALVLGDFHVVAFPGIGAAEHVAEAHLYDECWRRWVPWSAGVPASRPSAPTVPEESLASLALRLSLGEAAAKVGETPPGSNRVKPEYWAGCSRIVGGREEPLKMLVGPWCAAAFQWATYEAARRLGILAGQDQTSAWHAGPVPHGRRVSVAEIQADMTARGLYRPAAVVRSRAYRPQPGDAVFLDRPGGAGAGWGHVCRFVAEDPDGSFWSVGGNEAGDGSARDDAGDRWRLTHRKYTDPLLRGFGCFNAATSRLMAPLRALRPEMVAALDACAAEWAGRDRVDLKEGEPEPT